MWRVFVGLLVVLSLLRPVAAQQLGEWEGTTSQGLALGFTLVDQQGQIAIDYWWMEVREDCPLNGPDLWSYWGLGGYLLLDAEGRVQTDYRFWFGYLALDGQFGAITAAGTMRVISSILLYFGETPTMLAAKCRSGTVTWTAAPVSPEGSARAGRPAPDRHIAVTRHPDGTLTATVTKP